MPNKRIVIKTEIKQPVDKVWEMYTIPKHIVCWNNASEDWHTPHAENDLKVGGKFLFRMEAKDGSAGFDFEGVYDKVIKNELIAYSLADGRKVEVVFASNNTKTYITIMFDPEKTNPLDMQQAGWQAILDNFKNYVEKDFLQET